MRNYPRPYSPTIPVTEGGTGAITAAATRAALGLDRMAFHISGGGGAVVSYAG